MPASSTHRHISCWCTHSIQRPNAEDREQLCDVTAFALRAGEWWFLLAWSEQFLKRAITLFATKFVNWHFALPIKTEPHSRGCRCSAQIKRVTGLEPAALSLGSWCSTTELHPPGKSLNYTYWLVLLSRDFRAGCTVIYPSVHNFFARSVLTNPLIYTAWICLSKPSKFELG